MITHPTPLVLPESLARRIETEGVSAYPNECCGILIGRDVTGPEGTRRVVDRLVQGRNAFEADEQYHRFSIDPRQQLAAERSAEAEGKVVLGFYLSHPDHPARPSEYDRTHVPPWNFYSHIIVAIEKKQPAAMTCWVFNEDTEQFDEQPIQPG